ncbi:MAG: 7TM diverse intracellular signaling domain-containing protein [Candidatus Sericytochromatia bacterium]
MRLIICLLFFYIALNVNIASYSLVLEDINKEYFLSPELSYLNDKTNNLDIKDIDTKYKDKFSTEQLKSTNFGYSKYSHWFKFNIINKTNIDKWLLVIEFPKLYDVKLYNRDSNKFNVQENGTILKPSDRDIKSRKIVFNLPTKEGNNNFYIKVYSPETAVQVPMKIMTKDVFSTESMYEENFFMLFLGIFLGMIVYNFVVLVFFKEIIYLFYVLFNFSLFLTQLATNGYGYYYIWGNSSFEPISIRFCGNILFLSFTIFLMSFFDINRKNKFFNFFSIMAIFDFIHLILGLLHLLNIAYISKFIMIQAIVFVYILIYYLIKNKDKSTKILFISWTVLSLGIVIFLLNRMGLVEKNAFTDHILLIASSMSSIIISLAISEKFQSYKIQKEVYSRELELANEKLIDYKNNLEDIVERKTVELKESKEKAEKIAKLKSDFLASMSHDIRTPINGVMGMTELLSMTKLDQEQKGLVKTISSSSEILLNLINQYSVHK